MTQTRAPARALVGAAMIGTALALVTIAAHGAGQDPTTDYASKDNLTETGLRGAIDATETPAAAEASKLVQASLLPSIPTRLTTPVPGLAFRTPKLKASERDLECLTKAVYFESRGDTDVGQAAVAQVVLNRSRHPLFPKSVCGVVNQGVERRSCQFSFVCKPTKVNDQREWRRARQVAEKAMDGHAVDGVGTSTFFHAARINPGWKLTRVGQFGAHVFYRYPGKKGAPSAFAAEPKPSLMEQFTGPLQAVLNKPAVTMVGDPGSPILGFASPAKSATGAQVAAAVPVIAPAVSSLTTVQPPIASSAAAPSPVEAARPAAAPEATLQSISLTPATPAPALSSAS